MDFTKYKDTVYQIIGASMEVHSEMNWGLLEPVYNEALHLELLDRGIDNEREKLLPCYYKQHKLEKFYQMDIVVGDVIVELKSLDELCAAVQLHAVDEKPIGLLINFGQSSLQSERYGYNEETNECILLDKNMNPVYD